MTKEQVIDEIKRRNKNIYGDCTYGQLTRDEKIQVDILEDILKFAGEYKDDDKSRDTWDVNSIGHRFFEHYKTRAIIEYLDKMMDNMRESVVSSRISEYSFRLYPRACSALKAMSTSYPSFSRLSFSTSHKVSSSSTINMRSVVIY